MAGKKKAQSKKQIEAELKKLNRQLGDIREAEWAEKNKPFLGKAFKYQNCYSCPEGEEDYWFLYSYVYEVEPHYCGLLTVCFQTDINGDFEINRRSVSSQGGYLGEEIPLSEFVEAWVKQSSAALNIVPGLIDKPTPAQAGK